jgi:hypothetical protein
MKAYMPRTTKSLAAAKIATIRADHAAAAVSIPEHIAVNALFIASVKPAELSIVAAAAAKPATKTTIKSIIPSFEAYAKTIVSIQAKADKASSKASEVIAQSIQQYLDACIVSGLARDVQNAHAIKAAIGDCQAFVDAVACGTYESKTIDAYANGASRAFFHDVAWTPTLQNDPALKVPNKNGKVRASGAAESGTTTLKITRAALDKTLSKALEQMRALTLDDTAADLLDFLIDNLDGFTEATTEDAVI